MKHSLKEQTERLKKELPVRCTGCDADFDHNYYKSHLAKELHLQKEKFAKKRVAVTYKEDGGHGWAVPMSEILK